jgi:acyl-CoA thioester hydrolase
VAPRKAITSVSVAPNHIDYHGHVNNTVYVQWLEHARVQLLSKAGFAPKDAKEHGVALVLMESHIRFLRSVRLSDNVLIETWFSAINHLRVELQFRIFVGGVLMASAEQRGAFVDPVSLRPRALIKENQTKLERFAFPTIELPGDAQGQAA